MIPDWSGLPWRVRWWLRRHRKHGLAHVNTMITVPSFDPSALGILAECPCGKDGVW